MITKSESGLTQEEYDALLAASGDVATSIKVQRLGPVWSDPGHTAASVDTGLKAMLFDGQLVRVYLSDDAGTLAAEKLADESVSTQDWMSVGVDSNVSVNGDIQFDLVTDDTTLRLFYLNGDDKIAYSDCTDLSVGFGAPTAIDPAIDGISHLAATTLTTVHYITLTARSNRQFHVGNYSDTWYFADSDILYPFPIDSLSAVRLDDGADVLALTGTLPPLIGNRVIGTEITREVETVQSVLVFLYSNGRWSDHYVADTIDNIPSLPGRANIRLSYHNGIIFSTYMRKGGGDTVSYTRCAISRSVNGKFFQLPELVELDTPAVLIPRDDYLYLVGEDTLRSPRCVFAGQTPVEQDITSYVSTASSTAGDIRQTSYEMQNPAQGGGSLELDGTLSALAASQRMQAVYDLGYWVDGNSILAQVGVEDIAMVGKTKQLPVNNLSLMGMDRLGRLNRTSSDFAAEHPGMEIGRDPFDDPTGTGWGGMRHLASYKPSWKADEGTLKLVSNNKEGLVVSVFVVDTLNGTIQAGLSPGYDDQDEYAGLAFRVYDKDTLYYIAYHPDENEIQLYQRKGASSDGGFTDTLIDFIDTSGWNWTVATGTYFYLRAHAYYGRLYLCRSDDAVVWSAVSWEGSSETHTELPGQSSDADEYAMWSGKFGLIGRGYSDEDTNPWTPSTWTPPVIPIGPTQRCALMVSSTHKVVTFEVGDASTVWWDADPGGDIVGTPWNCIASKSGQAYIVTRGATRAAWYCDDLTKAMDGTISWTKEVEIVSDHFGAARVVNGLPLLVVHADMGHGYTGDWGSLVWRDIEEVSVILRDGAMNPLESCEDDPPPDTHNPARTSSYTGLRGIRDDGSIVGSTYRLPTHYAATFELAEGVMEHPNTACGGDDASHYYSGWRAGSDGGPYGMRYYINDAQSLILGGAGSDFGPDDSSIVDTGLTSDCGAITDAGGQVYYVKGGSLHRCVYETAIEFANRSLFLDGGAVRDGWLFQIMSNGNIFWQISTAAISYIGQHYILIMYDSKNGIWIDQTGNLEDVLGVASWDNSRGFHVFDLLEEILDA